MPESIPIFHRIAPNVQGESTGTGRAWACPAIETLSQPLPLGTDRGCADFWPFACAMPMTSRIWPRSLLAPLENREYENIRAPGLSFYHCEPCHSSACGAAQQRICLGRHCGCVLGTQSPRERRPAEQAAHAQQIDELERILAHLPVRVATALVLHRVAGYSVQEVGDELGVSRETAKKYLARAVEHCRTLRAGESIKGL